jgi:2-isopropylmalate synthase
VTEHIKTYDTTLRDGSQREGASLSVEDKWRIARRLDEFGIDYIEGGFVGSNHRDAAFFAAFASGAQKLTHAKLVAFGLPVRKGLIAADDPALTELASSPAEIVTIVGKASKLQATAALCVSTDENLRMIYDSVRFLRLSGKQVFFDAEHYFDAYKEDAGYVFEVIAAAIEAGAHSVVLADTNGGGLPHEIYEITHQTAQALAISNPDVMLGIHTHDDSGCAVANSIEALRAGAGLVQGTVNGYGERVGNANLLTVIANLELRLGTPVVGDARLRKLSSLSHFVADVFNIAPDTHAPYVGQAAFTHKGGLHVSAETRLAGAYQHVDPAAVGNFTHIVLSDLAGRAALAAKAQELGIAAATEEERDRLLVLIKQREAQGYSYEAADASLALLLQTRLDGPISFFRLESFRVITDRRSDGHTSTEATIKIHVGAERFIATAEGNGPVNALDAALRKAITRFYPQIEGLELRDFKVRVLDGSVGTGAVTRVFIETQGPRGTWGTVGVNHNIIEASWDALVDAITYGLLQDGQPKDSQAVAADEPAADAVDKPAMGEPAADAVGRLAQDVADELAIDEPTAGIADELTANGSGTSEPVD